MKRIYVAGAISSPNVIQFLENVRKGTRLSTEVLLAGYAAFSPFIDYSLFLQLRDGESIPKEAIQSQSMAWLEVSDAVILVPGWESSGGTAREIARAQELKIPIFYSIEGMNSYFK